MRLFAAIVFSCLLLPATLSNAQSTGFGSNVMSVGEVDDSPNPPPKVSVGLGTSFMAFSGVNSISTWIMPRITMPVSKKWNVAFGMGYSGIFLNGFEGTSGQQNQSQYGHLFVSGQYLLTEKISLTGTAYKTMMLNPSPKGDLPQDGRLDFSSQGVMLDMNYQVTDQFQINVGLEYRKQNYPIYPGMHPGFSTGFGDRLQGNGLSPFR
jgi:hypothetical protein